ncbi:MAG: GNAT family N-acetyltransferase [Pseudomonadota bacterium]
MTAVESFEIRPVRSASREDLILLYTEAGWWDDACRANPGFVLDVVTESACFVGAFQGNIMVGMGRALSDRVSDAYIQDVAVLRAFRGRGIGSRIIKCLIAELKKIGVDWIGLIGEPGTEPFYEKLGFKPMTGYIPLKYEG